jgi:hypothetical protein
MSRHKNVSTHIWIDKTRYRVDKLYTSNDSQGWTMVYLNNAQKHSLPTWWLKDDVSNVSLTLYGNTYYKDKNV